jgi:hypothetical protein
MAAAANNQSFQIILKWGDLVLGDYIEVCYSK